MPPTLPKNLRLFPSLSGPVSMKQLGALLAVICFYIIPPVSTANAQTLMASTAQRGGAVNLAWTPSAQSSVDIPLTGMTLATGSSVEVWMHLPSRAPEGVQLTVEMLGMRATLPLQWTGWRRLVIPVSAMKATSGAYNTANRMRLLTSGTFSGSYKINYCGGTVATTSTGPGVEDEDLLDHIDLNRAGMEAVKTAVQSASSSSGSVRTTAINQAKAALAKYYRQNLTARWPMGSTTSTTSADTFAAGTFTYVGNTHTYNNLGGVLGAIDWSFNPTLQPGFTGAINYEWGFSMNRHGHWDTLTKAYNGTTAASKEKYAAYWAGNLRSWVAQEPAPAIRQETDTSAWRGLEAGLRLSRSWPASFFVFSQSITSVSDEDILLFLKSVLDHGNFLSGHAYSAGNHYTMAMCGLVTQGAVFPEFIDALFWRTSGQENLAYSLNENTLGDGAWYECAPSYHVWVTDKISDAFNSVIRNGFSSEVADPLWEKLIKMGEWLVQISAPDRVAPTLNDGGPVKTSSATFTGWESKFSSPLLSWANTLQTETASQDTVPATSLKSLALPDSGYTVMRSGWGKTDHYALFDVGPLGGWHGHQDALNLVTYFYGRPFLFDNGGFTYDTSVWRDYGTSTASHNTIRVNSLDQARTYDSTTNPVGTNDTDTPPPRFGTSDAIDYASGWYVGGYGSTTNRIATHRREIAFLKPTASKAPLMVVVDTLTSRNGAAHAYDLRWHLKSTNWQSETGQGKAGRYIWTTDRDVALWPNADTQPNLAIVSVSGPTEFYANSGVTGTDVNTTLGWFYPSQSADPVPALTLRQRTAASASTVRMVTLLVPFTGAANNPVTGIVASSSTANTWTIQFLDNRTPVTLSLNASVSNIEPSFSINTTGMPPLQPLSSAKVWQPTTSSTPVEGAGTWNLSGNNWRNNSGTLGAWQDYQQAIMGNGAALASNYSIALAQPVTVSELRFDTTGGNQYSITNPSGTGNITFPSIGRPAIYVRSNALVSTPLETNVGFDKTGPGTLRLEADNQQAVGQIRVSEGVLQIGNNGSSGTVGAASIDVAAGATLTIRKVNTSTSSFANSVSGDGALAIQLRGDSPLTLRAAPNSTALLSHKGATTFSSSSTNVKPSLAMGAANLLSPSSTFTFVNATPSTSTITLSLGSYSQTIGGLEGGDADCITDLGTATLTVGANGVDTHYSGRLQGTGSLVKTGANLLRLSGDNRSFTGSIAINSGKLMADSILASAVTVRSGAIFTGNGSTTGNLTVLTGSALELRVQDWNASPPPFTAASLVATGATSWTLRLDTTGLGNFSETARSFPVVTATKSLTNVSPTAIALLPIGFPGKGVWSVSVTGNTLALNYAPDRFAGWSTGISWGSKDSSPTADPDRDGISNLLEYALNSDPLGTLAGTSITHGLSANAKRVTVTFNRIADPALTYEVLASGNMSTWSVIWSSTGAANVAGPVTVTDIVDMPTTSGRFLRLRVNR